MIKLETRILNSLIDKYERSKTFSGNNVVRQSFEIKIGKLLPRYLDETDYAYFTVVNDAVESLLENGLVTVTRNGDVIKNVRLELSKLDSSYEFLQRRPKQSVHDELCKLLTQYSGRNEFLKTFCVRQLEQITANRSVQGFDGDFNEFENILKVLCECFDVRDETFRRDFSARVLGDSKAFENISSKIATILWDYRNSINFDFSQKETIFEDLNIIRNPTHVFFKGDADLCFRGQSPLGNGDSPCQKWGQSPLGNGDSPCQKWGQSPLGNGDSPCQKWGQSLNLGLLGGDIALSSSTLKSLVKINVRATKVMTIENLTTFNAFNDRNVFAIYLGGFHNTVRRELIKTVYENNPDKEYLHYGDIDAGGFHILQHLRRKTGIAFNPFRMDVSTLIANRSKWKPLSENDRNRLKHFADTEFAFTTQYMLKNNCKLEQEQLD